MNNEVQIESFHVLTLLYSERPKLNRVLAVLSAIGSINIKINPGKGKKYLPVSK